MPDTLEYSDKSMVKSNFVRPKNDTFYTEPWVTVALVTILKAENVNISTVWEPACGRGDMVKELRQEYFVLASDIDISKYISEFQYPHKDYAYEKDFLLETNIGYSNAIITNPPYNIAKEFINHALGFNVEIVAMLMRNEWDCAKTRNYLFTEKINNKRFALKIVLTSRPRWDNWWEKEKPDKSPRHNYSWYVWINNWQGPPIIRYHGKS